MEAMPTCYQCAARHNPVNQAFLQCMLCNLPHTPLELSAPFLARSTYVLTLLILEHNQHPTHTRVGWDGAAPAKRPARRGAGAESLGSYMSCCHRPVIPAPESRCKRLPMRLLVPAPAPPPMP